MTEQKHVLFYFGLIFLFSLLVTTPTLAISISQDGIAQAVIVIDPHASAAEQHAADELAAFLQQISGAQLPLIKQSAADPSLAGKPRLLVGPDAARWADANFTTAGLDADGLIIRTAGNDLILAGGRPRGTLYAVYTFLENLGCRWWSSTVSTLPQQPTLQVDSLNIHYVPALEYRESFWFDAFDGDWAVRNKCNGNQYQLDEKRGGQIRYEGFVHTFFRPYDIEGEDNSSLIAPSKYFQDHPEWFSEIGGKREYHDGQLCLTNESMRQELVKNLKIRLRQNPIANIASVSQNDNQNYCRCPRCAAVDQEEASPAGTLLRFVNAVAADIEEEFPHLAISTLAYQYTRKPPRLVKPRPNVIVRLCSIECSFSQPLIHERNQAFRDDIVAWSQICNRLYIWDYTTNFRHYLLPHPNLRVLAPNVKFFVAHHVKGIFEQGAYNTHGAEMAELKAWVLAKLLWDPSLDGQKLIDEFLNGYYGPAAKHIRDYLELTHNAVEASGDWLGCFSKETAEFLTFDMLNHGWAHLIAAAHAVQGDETLLKRVRIAQLPVMYVFLFRWNDLHNQAQAASAPWPLSDSIDAAYAEFRQIAQQANITRIKEAPEGFGQLEEAIKNAQP